MSWELAITLIIAVIGSAGISGVMATLINRRKIIAEAGLIRAETDIAYAQEFRKDLDAAKVRISELEQDMLHMHREMKELTRENIELRKKVARLESENERLETLLQRKGN